MLASYAKCFLRDVCATNAQNAVTPKTKKSGPQYCGLPPEPLDITGA